MDPFLLAADVVARERNGVDAGIARGLMGEAATLLHNGLALDGLDEQDTATTIALLSNDLVAPDPSAAVRARAQSVLEEPGELHDSRAVSAAILISAAILEL